MAELDTEEERLEFKWGKKGGIGGKKKDVQFYDSFTFDGEAYKLFDDVYLHNEGEGDPYIGKLIKIWENPDKSKKVKIQWFYHPSDIRDFLEGYEPRNKELFLACGEGIGLADINPVEAVARKCNVICISEDIRNPQPSDEELKMADFVFCRFFDVGLGKILDKINGKIAGIDGNQNIWIVDSGATSHVTRDKSLFKHYNPCHNGRMVKIADGSRCQVAGTGLITLSKDIELKAVLHVPNISHNLLSVSKLTQDLNCVAKFFPNLCEFQTLDSGRTIGSARMCSGHYRLQTNENPR